MSTPRGNSVARDEAGVMTKRIVVLTAAALTAGLSAVPAAADPVCAGAQASGMFLVEHVGPVCPVDTPLPTSTHTQTVQVGVETVTVTYSAP